MSRERKRGPYNKPRQAEAKVCEQAWKGRRSTRKPLPGWWELIENSVNPEAKAAGMGDHVAQILLIATATNNPVLHAAVIELIRIGLGTPEWRTRLKREFGKLPQPFDIMREINASDEALEASDRQAAERTVAKFGGGTSFSGQVTEVRGMLTRARRNDGAVQASETFLRDFAALIHRFGGEPPPVDQIEAEVKARVASFAKSLPPDFCQD